MAARTDDEIERAARSDPDCPPLTDAELREMRPVPEVKRIRHRLGMSQEDFAREFRLSLATLRDWEQGRCPPDQAARTLIQLIGTIPKEVRSALSGGKQS